MQLGASSKRKVYAAVVWVSAAQTRATLASKLDTLVDLPVAQLTPMRVMHRRSLLSRRKMVHSMRATWLNPHFFILHIEASAGTYIKELVHGDLGRTQPNVGELLVRAQRAGHIVPRRWRRAAQVH